MTKEVLNARISPKTEEQLEDWADDMGITKSEATNRLLDKALEIEDNDDVIVQTDGGVIEERFDRLEKQIPDGEAIERFEEIEEQTQSIASDQQFTTKIHGWMALSLVWIGFVLSLSPPSVWTAATGAVLLFGFVVNWAKEYLAGKE